MDAYYQGMRAQRKLSRMGFKGHRSGKGKGKGMSKGKLSLPKEVRTESVSMLERGAAPAVTVEEKDIGEETPSVRK